jgi:hypothetical protein
MAERKLVPYPWHSLEKLTRQSVRAGTLARRALDRAVDVRRLAGELAGVVGAEASFVVHRVLAADARPPSRGATLAFEVGDDAARIELTFEPELAAFVLSRVLGRAPALSANGVALDPALRGALSAVVIETCRRTRAGVLLRVADPRAGAAESAAGAALVDGTVLLDGQPFPLTLWAKVALTPTRGLPAPSLAALGELPVAVPLVAGAALAERSELAALEPGDAWLAGEGWWIDGSGSGRCALIAGTGELGAGVDLAPDGRIVVRGDRVALLADPTGAMADSDTIPGNLADAVLDSPVVVRVELGAVTLTAREWAALRAGDVIETGRRIAEPVVLRVAGRELARGELVNVEGELGVRVLEILDEPRSG